MAPGSPSAEPRLASFRRGNPPMADIGRSGCRKDGSLMPWPGSLTATARCHRPASSASLAPARNGPRRSLSVRANRQLRTWPSAVSRTRSQLPQNGLVTDAITPTWAGPPSTRNVSAGADPRLSGSSGVRANSRLSAAKISSAVIISARFQPCCASSGICSMKRSSYPWSRQNLSSGAASSSFRSRISTALTLTGVRPASAAAASPSSTSGSRSRRASLRNVSGRTVSSDTLIRSSPASCSAPALRLSPMAFVVREISGRGRSAAVRATMPTRPRRSSGSPPVNLTSRMPSRSTATPISRITSSSVSSSGEGSQSSPSGGMQYAHRRLHRSVSDTRRSVAIRPKESGSILPAYA
jgi:hypothetical protein